DAAEPVDRRKLMLLGLVVIAGGLVVGGFMLFGGDAPPTFPPEEQCRRMMLAMNDQLWTIPGGPPKTTGSQFWFDVLSKPPHNAMLKCPGGKGKGRVDFRGPVKQFSDLKEHDVLAVDLVGNHPGGVNALMRNGQVTW